VTRPTNHHARSPPATVRSAQAATTRLLRAADRHVHPHNRTVLCAAGRPLSLTTWLAVPYLFSTAVVGLTALAGLLLGFTNGEFSTLSTPVFGAATAVTAAASASVTWRSTRQRRWLRWPYPTSVLGVGIAVDGIRLPAALAIGLGVPTIALLLHWYAVERRRSAALAAAGHHTNQNC
jgi:hypothetical protein